MTMKNFKLAIAAGIIASIAMCFASSATASPVKESAAEIDAKLQNKQFTQSAANQVYSK